MLQPVAQAVLPTRWGLFQIFGYESGGESAVLLRMPAAGDAETSADASSDEDAPLLRIHSQCLTGDVFGSLRCDCRQQLELALETIAALGAGMVIYEDKEGRGIGLMAKLKAYELQDQGADTVEANLRLGYSADHRTYALPVRILQSLGVRRVRLLSNNPEKIAALEEAGIRVVERVACQPEPTSEYARRYLETKRRKLGHLL